MLTEVDIKRIMAAKLRFYETVFEDENYDFLNDEGIFESLNADSDNNESADTEQDF